MCGVAPLLLECGFFSSFLFYFSVSSLPIRYGTWYRTSTRYLVPGISNFFQHLRVGMYIHVLMNPPEDHCIGIGQ